MYWVNESVFYHIYPLGFCGAPKVNDGKKEYRLDKVIDFIPHLKEMNVNAVYFGPVFMSATHGYDTSDYYHIDNRLGDNESFEKICRALHENGIKVVLDGVFNHVGRGFWAFKDIQKNGSSSPYCSWFQRIDFGGRSSWGDNFWYEGWEGNYDLVKLNLRHPDVKKHIFEAVKMWKEKFQIDGLRLDVAYCMDIDFLKELRNFCKGMDKDFWLMGEIIHGDYNRIANPNVLDSCTNYECYKGIYSSHNDHNYFEIAHSLRRQFENGGIYKNIDTYNFVDNHDVNRIASTIKEFDNVKNAFSVVYFMPGVPSVYYGSEWGIKGQKNNVEYDAPLRPCVNLGDIQKNDLYYHICKLGAVRRTFKALKYGSYQNVVMKNEQLVFKRQFDGETVYIALNLSGNDFGLDFNTDGGAKLYDVMNEYKSYDVYGNRVHIDMPAHGTMVLVLTDGGKPADLIKSTDTEINQSEPEKKAEPEKAEKKSELEKVEKNPEPVKTETKSEPKLPERNVPGKYRHFRGEEYELLFMAKNAETMEDLVIYRELSGEHKVWAKPAYMFYEFVKVNGKRVPRFEKIG